MSINTSFEEKRDIEVKMKEEMKSVDYPSILVVHEWEDKNYQKVSKLPVGQHYNLSIQLIQLIQLVNQLKKKKKRKKTVNYQNICIKSRF